MQRIAAISFKTLILMLVTTAFATHAGATDYAAPGPHALTIETGDMTDPKRDRTVPYKIYRPRQLSGPHPVVLFSHGLGGSREAAEYLGTHLASHGYIAVHLQHPGSDQSIWEGARTPAEMRRRMQASLRKPSAALDRFRDIPFVVDTLEAWNSAGPLAGHIDLNAIGMSGHSYGARSTLAAAGERLGRRAVSMKEPRLAAAIAYSPNLPQRGGGSAEAYADIDVPILHVTGTEDGYPLDPSADFDPAQRTEPFKRIPSTPQYLLVLDGADHSVFSGRAQRGGPRPKDEAFQALTRAASLAFWQAHLRGDGEASKWLRSGALSGDPDVARWEIKE